MEYDHSVLPEELNCEDVTDEVISSYLKIGYRLTFAEEVMHFDLSRPIPQVVVQCEVSYLGWTPERSHDFFTVYASSFRERPGYPGWSEAEWVSWTSDDPAFRPDLSVLAVVQGQPVGFVTNADYEEAHGQQGYLIQLGVHPSWRGKGLGAALTIHSLQQWREAGKAAVILHVNINNPGAIRLYQQVGFVIVRRRGKFSRS
ncbi:MAG: GNAT family N-acetyltransferase [Chloroflexi bacterium]|nr:GNAT family N-acetyltransferase [Chloroflexota bacterium]